MAEKLNPFYKLLKAEVPINTTSELKGTFDRFSEQSTEGCLRTSIETTYSVNTACLSDRCKFQKRWLCPYD